MSWSPELFSLFVVLFLYCNQLSVLLYLNLSRGGTYKGRNLEVKGSKSILGFVLSYSSKAVDDGLVIAGLVTKEDVTVSAVSPLHLGMIKLEIIKKRLLLLFEERVVLVAFL